MIAHVPEPQEAHMDLTTKTARELEEILAATGAHVPAKAAKKTLIQRIQAAVGLTIKPDTTGLERDLRGPRPPFDREARDALKPRPVMLIEQKGTNRFLRRHRVHTFTTIDHQRAQRVTTIKKRWRRPATMVPATARQIDIARYQAFAPAPAGRSFFKGA